MHRVLPSAILLFVISQSLAVEIDTKKQLLVDDYVIDKQQGMTRVVQQPNRLQQPIITADHSWEGKVLEMPTVLWDKDRHIFRMYYWAANKDGNIYTCYAESRDGFVWKKPILNLHKDAKGSTRNNIVLRGSGKVARTRYVFYNPDQSNKQRKFLSLYIDNVPGLTEFLASSPDGLHWKTEKKIGDLRHVKGGKVSKNPPFFLIEQQWGRAKDGHRYRAIWRTQSADMKKWSGGQLVIQRLPDDSPDLEFYHAASHMRGNQNYHGIHFGYLYLYHSDPVRGVRKDGIRLEGTIDTSLMFSRDTINWTRVDRKRRFIPLGAKGSWEAGMNFTMPEVIVGDRMLFYYCAFRGTHDDKNNRASIGVGVLPLDRFVSYQPSKSKGQFTTKAFKLTGQRLEVNANASRGSLRVEVLDAKGKVVNGFGGDSATTISNDRLRAQVRWAKPLKSLKGKTIRLRFLVERAKVFAFQVR